MVRRTLSAISTCAGDLGHHRNAARSGAVAPQPRAEHDARLLELPQALPERRPCARGTESARGNVRTTHSAGDLCAGSRTAAAGLFRRGRWPCRNRAGGLRSAARCVRRIDSAFHPAGRSWTARLWQPWTARLRQSWTCLLYTSDAADEEDSVDL